MEIRDAVAVVTGGASGLGLATTKALLDEGAQVVISTWRAARARQWPRSSATARASRRPTSPIRPP